MSEIVLGHGLDTKPEMTFTLDPIAPNVLPPDPTLRDAIPMLSRLVRDPEFLQSHVLPLLEEAGRAEDWYVAYRHDDSDRSCSLQVFVWPPGSATSIHDHSSWGRSVVLWDPSWKSATSVPTMAPCQNMPA